MKLTLALTWLAMLVPSALLAGVYNGPTDDATFDELLTDVDAKIVELDQKIQAAETAGVTTDYAQVSRVTIDLFRNSFAPYDRANVAEVQAMYDAKYLGQFDPVGPVGLPFDELADAIEVADAAIAELDAQIAGNVDLQSPPDFAAGMPATLNGTHYEKDGKTVFPTRFFWQPEDEEIMRAFGRMGEGYYSVQFMNSPTTVIPWRITDFALTMQHQADINRTPAQFFLGHIVPSNHVLRATVPEAFASGSRLFTHYDIDNPDVRGWLTVLWQEMMSAGANALIGHERVHMMSNEPVFSIREGGVHADRGVSSYTTDKYGNWLQAKYGNIATLNAAYGTTHADFEAVKTAYTIPLPLSYQGGPVWYDWNQFNYDRVNEWFAFLNDGHKAVDPSGKTHLKLMGERSLHVQYNDEGLDFEYISNLVDVPGSDAQMTSHRAEFDSRHDQSWRGRWEIEWRAQSMMLDFMKSIAPTKPMFDSEWHGLSGSRWRDYHMSPEYVRAALWLAFTEGVSAMNAWVWNRRADGSIDTRADFVGTTVTQPIQLDAFGRTMKELNAHGDAIGQLVATERNFLVYYNKDSAIQDPDYTREMSDVYEALKILNVPVGFTTPADLVNVSTANQAVIVPPTPYITDADFAALGDLIANGGNVVVVDAVDNFSSTELGATRADTSLVSPTVTFGEVFDMADEFTTEFASQLPSLPLTVSVTTNSDASAYGVMAKQYNDNDRYVVTLINLSQQQRNVALTVPDGIPNDVLNMITNQSETDMISMAPLDVLLLSIGQTVDAPTPPPPPPPPSTSSGGGGSVGFLSVLALLAFGLLSGCSGASTGNALEDEALTKIDTLESLMDEARSASIDVKREETLLWFSKEFLKFANWDEANKEMIEQAFGYYVPYQEEKEKYADELPDFERAKVIEMLDDGIGELQDVVAGEVVRPPVNPIDWQNIVVTDDKLLSNGKPVFLFDYFSKSVGRPLTDAAVYNDHLGAIFHGGENLYPVDHDRAVNPFLVREDRSFDEELLSEITGISDTNVGFLILWNSGIPQWIHDQEPEVAKGRSLFTGFDVDNPLVRDVWGQIMRKTGELTKGKKVTQLGYILSNEPHWFSEEGHWTQRFQEMNSISSYTLNNFRDWLDETYAGNIEGLNTNWNREFESFSEVSIDIPISPDLRGSPIWYDWSRYNMDRGIDWFTHLQNELHKTNPDGDTHIKIMPRMWTENYRSHGIDYEALTQLTTMIGDDSAANASTDLVRGTPAPWEEHYAYFWEETALSYDFMESVAPGKIHVNSETHFLSTSRWRWMDMPTDYTRSIFWLATIHGMDVGISWFWARDPDGSPEDRLEGELNFFDPALAGSYAGSANMQPHTVNEKAQVYMDMNSVSEEIYAIRTQRRPLRLFYSETSAINKNNHMTQLFETYESLYFEGLSLGFATQKVLEQQDASEWDAILVHRTEYVTDSEFAALQGYLDGGGTVVLADSDSLTLNEYGKPREVALEAGNGQLVRLSGASKDEVRDAALEQIAASVLPVTLTEDNGTDHKGTTWRVVESPSGGYIVNVLNIGKNTARLELSLASGERLRPTDMLTGKALESTFELQPNGVLLLEVR